MKIDCIELNEIKDLFEQNLEVFDIFCQPEETMIHITINDQKFEVSKDLSVLEAAREQGIHIPTLCYHEALESVGACRLCIVEVEQNGRSRTVASCVTPVVADMIVRTNTEKIQKMRRVLIELLLRFWLIIRRLTPRWLVSSVATVPE